MPRRCADLLIVLALAASGGSLRAAGPPGLSLIGHDRLAGWDLIPSHGWQVHDGELRAADNATSLSAGWTFGDFELTFQWSAAKPARLTLGFTDAQREGDSEIALSLALCEGNGCGELRHGDALLAEGGELEATENGWHQARLHRRGDALALTIDDRSFSDVAIPVRGRLGLRISVDGGAAALCAVRLIEPAGEPIFNGRDLTGWWTPGNLDGWQVQDGTLACLNRDGNYLRSDHEFADFVFSFEYRMARGGNSGIGIRTPRAGWPSGDGMELQLLDEPLTAPLTRHSTMAIYGNLEPLAKADRSGEWNHVAIRAEQRVISAWVNGTLVQFADTARLGELRRRHLKGWIGLQDHGARIEFRDLRVGEILQGKGPARPVTENRNGSEWVLDRLMNPRRLALDDGLSSGTVDRVVEGPAEVVLADLAGPGAVVEIEQRGPAGQLALYFDGEASPRFEGTVAEMYLHAPQVGQDQQPLLSYLPFRRSLKIVARSSDASHYRLDYVTFPAAVPLETVSLETAPLEAVPLEVFGGENGVARGLLPALSYRNEQMGWGTHRESDPLPRKSSPPQTIGPGETKELLRLDGSGVVEWTKLQAPVVVLTNDDLWLEVRYGGQEKPAVAAPARFLFPGLAGGNYPNYVVVDRGGFTSMVAMPYRDGLTISAANKGPTRVDSVAVTVSFEPSAKAEPNTKALDERSLFGVYTRETGPGGPVRVAGPGRLVGLVRHCHDGSSWPAGALEIDGHARDGGPGGQSGLAEFRRSLRGRFAGLEWRFFWLAPVDFMDSLVLGTGGSTPAGGQLLLYYAWDGRESFP